MTRLLWLLVPTAALLGYAAGQGRPPAAAAGPVALEPKDVRLISKAGGWDGKLLFVRYGTAEAPRKDLYATATGGSDQVVLRVVFNGEPVSMYFEVQPPADPGEDR